jgi:hypothetical protein
MGTDASACTLMQVSRGGGLKGVRTLKQGCCCSVRVGYRSRDKRARHRGWGTPDCAVAQDLFSSERDGDYGNTSGVEQGQPATPALLYIPKYLWAWPTERSKLGIKYSRL